MSNSDAYTVSCYEAGEFPLQAVANENDHIISMSGWLKTWQCGAFAPGSVTHPSQLNSTASEWLPASVPGTVASAMAANDLWSFERPPEIDAQDWWYRAVFDANPADGQHSAHLHFEGLATLAEVWLNGDLLLTSDNMFRSHCVDISARIKPINELVIAFRSVSESLKGKRPRPRWKTNLVNNQQLRWLRTTLQGRIPGWSPAAPAIGPWRGIRLEMGPITPHAVYLRPRLQGTTGIVTLEAQLLCANPIQRASLRVGGQVESIFLEREVDGYSLHGQVQVPNARPWWPHTHGQPALYDCELVIESQGRRFHWPLDPVGFRHLEVHHSNGFEIRINDQPVYCRGACWTVSDLLTLSGTEEQLRRDLTLARDAGVNMLRVGGTMVYEQDAFYRLCDELGIMIWQDFMFANMDYPTSDETFAHNVTAEATEQLARLATHACIAVYCGNSEIEQQAAMLGMPRELWSNSWFSERLPELCQRLHPGTFYVPSTPTGGVLPFQAESGLTHYYGVGAYLRSPSDVRRSNVKFTTECLGFSNVPDPATIDAITPGANPVMHDPRWKRRVPRDTGAGWDFEDVRDHYLRELFQVDPIQLRSRDSSRYLQLSRIVSGEMMLQVFSEWRSGHSQNHGGLVWFYKDLWPAAGWGIVDSTGLPKAAYYYLKRTWQSQQLLLTDEGLNGLHLHLVNETSEACNGTVEVLLLKEGRIVVARQEMAARVEARSRRIISADEVLGGFYDVSYAYRFGPRNHDVVIATWYGADRQVIGEAFHFINRSVPVAERNLSLEATVDRGSGGEYRLSLASDVFLQGVTVASKGYLPDDNYFHLVPGRVRIVTFRPQTFPSQGFKVSIESLSLDSGKIVAVRPASQ